jgi:hypothetical protein
MDSDLHPGRLPYIGSPHPLGSVLHLWWRTWRAALAAEDAYEMARTHGAAHDIASHEAFKVLTRHDRPTRPETASGARETPAGGAMARHDRSWHCSPAQLSGGHLRAAFGSAGG